MTDEERHGRTVAVFYLVFLALSWATVDGAIFSRESRRDVPQNVDKRLLQRQKRAATTTTAPPPGSARSGSQTQVLLKEVVLNGTERHYTAYVHWSGKEDSDVMFILTVKYNYTGFADSQVWKSTDYGSTFSNYSFGEGVLVSNFYVSPADPTKMVFTDTQDRKMYTTHDELKSHQNFSLPVASDDLYMHPTNSDWIILFDVGNGETYVTMNFGAKWTHLQSDVLTLYWGVPGVDDPHTVHLEIQRKDSDDSFYMRCTIPDCNSTGDSIDTGLGPFLPYSLLVSNEFIFVQRVLQDGKESHMMVSYNRGNFSNAYFPNSVKTQDFMVLDTSEGQVFLAVNHGDRQGASLYLSDPTGQYYVLSLTNVHHRSFGHWFDVDLHKIKGLNGTYLANQQSKTNSNNLTSLVSFNKGGDWLKVHSPKTDCKTDDNCSLVLRLDMSSYFTNWILSEKRAPNFIIAHGHYGSIFQSSWSNLSVFTSNDGGWTWKESPLKGVYHFNILDQGSIVTAIKMSYMENTSQVHYSYDEGNSWQSEKFKEETLYVNGVLNEPSINTLVLSVYGHTSRSSPWTMVKLNFSQVLSRKCNDSQDYTRWSPSDHDSTVHENCLLGQVVTYKCKKAASRCFNGEDFVRTVEKNPCECAEEDFECDFGFFLNNGVCQKEQWFDEGFIAPECTEHQTYNKSGGYRKVGTDKCVRGLENNSTYQTSTEVCPLVKPGSLLITVNVTVVATGQPVLFHLIQKRGSVHSTQYMWRFSRYSSTNVTGLHNAQHQVMTFWYSSVFYISVTATNANGTSTSNVLSIKVENPIHRVAVYSVLVARVGDPVTIFASTYSRDISLHYQFRFGDEASSDKDLLTYDSNATHTYNHSGSFTLTVTALNSISAATEQASISIIDDGIVAQLTFSPAVDRMFSGDYHSYHFYILKRFQEELTTMLGIKLDRLALSLVHLHPVRIDCLIVPKLPKAPVYEKTAEQIAQAFVDMVENQTLSLFLDSFYMRLYGDINITAIHIMDYSGHGSGGGNNSGNCTGHGRNCTDHGHNCTDNGRNCTDHGHNSTDNGRNCTDHGHNCTDNGRNCTDHGHNSTDNGRNCTDHGHNCTDNGRNCTNDSDHHGNKKNSGINYRAIYIAVPVVAVAGIVTVIVIVIYRRRSRSNRYSLLDRDGSADPFFDEDDDLPLDMADARDTGHDEPMLDLRTGN